MNKEELVSVIVPIYNVEKYLKRCIESIIGQTYKNLEIILVNDGSLDNSICICEEYAKLDNRIKIIDKKNGGLSSARNAGIDVAKGVYLIFVDSDDYVAPNMIENLYSSVKKNNVKMAIGNYSLVDDMGNLIQSLDRELLEECVLTKEEYLMNMTRNMDGTYVVAWNKIYSKDLWLNYRYPVGKIHEDEFAIHNIICQCEDISCIDDVIYYYVQRDGSIMAEEKIMSRLDAVEAKIQRLGYFLSEKKYDHAILCEEQITNTLMMIYGKCDSRVVRERYQTLVMDNQKIYESNKDFAVCKKTRFKMNGNRYFPAINSFIGRLVDRVK